MTIIKNNTEGYGYKYASLGDIAEQGVEIPKMKTGTDEGIEYVYYYDTDLAEWIRGARVVIPENKGMNNAQLYASAVTYARRVTTQLAKQLACRDDEAIEETDENGEMKKPRKATDAQIEYVKKLYSSEEQARICEHYKVEDIADLDQKIISQYIASARARNEKHNQ